MFYLDRVCSSATNRHGQEVAKPSVFKFNRRHDRTWTTFPTMTPEFHNTCIRDPLFRKTHRPETAPDMENETPWLRNAGKTWNSKNPMGKQGGDLYNSTPRVPTSQPRL